MTKMTAVVLIIGVPDLLTSVQLIYARNFLQIPLLTVACFWYLVVVSVLTIVQAHIERRFGRGIQQIYGRRPGGRSRLTGGNTNTRARFTRGRIPTSIEVRRG
jgi:polar amino acid transport system permease protein